MNRAAAEQLQDLHTLDATSAQYATEFVRRLLTAAIDQAASDIHLQPAAAGLDVCWRIDGVLQPIGVFPPETAANVVSRLKVLADLLTYRSDIPQEGRIRAEHLPEKKSADEPGAAGEMRVSTFPTLYGERAVVRLFPGAGRYQQLADLGLPEEIAVALPRLLAETSGAILVTGPAGSGKTTTLYACLRHLVAASQGSKSIVSLEDPIEVAVEGVAQSQVNASAGFDMQTGLKHLMRQDPEVILVGEMRGPDTAQLALAASLTGHLLLSSFHAGSAAGAISRLADMGIEPYLLRSGVLAILSQRLVRKLCRCARQSDREEDRLGLPVEKAWVPVGCDDCRGSGYQGRILLAEMLVPDQSDLGREILSRSDADRLEQLAVVAGMVTRWERGCAAVAQGVTSPEEIRRVLGFRGRGSAQGE